MLLPLCDRCETFKEKREAAEGCAMIKTHGSDSGRTSEMNLGFMLHMTVISFLGRHFPIVSVASQ